MIAVGVGVPAYKARSGTILPQLRADLTKKKDLSLIRVKVADRFCGDCGQPARAVDIHREMRAARPKEENHSLGEQIHREAYAEPILSWPEHDFRAKTHPLEESKPLFFRELLPRLSRVDLPRARGSFHVQSTIRGVRWFLLRAGLNRRSPPIEACKFPRVLDFALHVGKVKMGLGDVQPPVHYLFFSGELCLGL